MSSKSTLFYLKNLFNSIFNDFAKKGMCVILIEPDLNLYVFSFSI